MLVEIKYQELKRKHDFLILQMNSFVNLFTEFSEEEHEGRWKEGRSVGYSEAARSVKKRLGTID